MVAEPRQPRLKCPFIHQVLYIVGTSNSNSLFLEIREALPNSSLLEKLQTPRNGAWEWIGGVAKLLKRERKQTIFKPSLENCARKSQKPSIADSFLAIRKAPWPTAAFSVYWAEHLILRVHLTSEVIEHALRGFKHVCICKSWN